MIAKRNWKSMLTILPESIIETNFLFQNKAFQYQKYTSVLDGHGGLYGDDISSRICHRNVQLIVE